MRGYFGIGIEGASKAMNVGALFRTAHAFGASFVFTLAAAYARREGARADTSDAPAQVPFYSFPDVARLVLPEDCRLVGVEITEDAAALPAFPHPRQAAYVLGRERGRLSDALVERCDSVVRIPTAFALNVAIAGAIIMYDRLLSHGRFARRPLSPAAAPEAAPAPVFGNPKVRRKMETFLAMPPAAGGRGG